VADSWHGDADRDHGCAGGDLLGTVLYWCLDLEFADMNTYDTGNLKIRTPPPPVGGYRMGDEADGGWIIFNLPKKPCWAHRMGVRLVLGWKWVDA
jgi:hypothetical protein